MKGAPTPTLREAVGIFAVIAATQVFGLITHDAVFTAVVSIVICAAAIGWWIWSNRYH
jgi:hypothetical protein